MFDSSLLPSGVLVYLVKKQMKKRTHLLWCSLVFIYLFINFIVSFTYSEAHCGLAVSMYTNVLTWTAASECKRSKWDF